MRTRWRRLRFRLTAAFSIGALLLAFGISLATYALARRELLDQREASAVRQARANARLVRRVIRAPDPDIPRLLTSLETAATSRSLLRHDGRWYATTAVVGRASLPAALRDTVLESGSAARQRIALSREPALAVGIPLAPGEGYFEVFPLTDVARTLRTLSVSLAAASAVLFAGSLALSAWASRRVLTPVAEIGRAATAIAGGHLDARLDAAGDEELFALATSFNAMVDGLQARIERDARFASDVSHELRSPLTTLRSAVQIMEARRSDMAPRAARALDLLAVEVRRFDRLVQDLLEISRYDAGAARLDLEDVDLPALAESVAHEHQPEARVTVHDGVSHVKADRRRLEQAIRNLVGNTITHAGALDRIVVDATASTVRIAVEDRGPGVPEDDRTRIFDRFSRGRASGRRSSGDGVGLGLALVAEHIRLQHGRVWVEDRDGGGARFVIEIPRVA